MLNKTASALVNSESYITQNNMRKNMGFRPPVCCIVPQNNAKFIGWNGGVAEDGWPSGGSLSTRDGSDGRPPSGQRRVLIAPEDTRGLAAYRCLREGWISDGFDGFYAAPRPGRHKKIDGLRSRR